MSDQGVLFIATGEEYIGMAERSAQSVKRYHPDLPITLVTDHQEIPDVFDNLVLWEFSTERIGDRSWLINSHLQPEMSPYDQTLYLDADTLVMNPIQELFSILEHGYDLGAHRLHESYRVEIEHLPEWHSHINTGVIVYQDNQRTRSLFEDWDRRFWDRVDRQAEPLDQPTFAEALLSSEVRWYDLPRRYNIRISSTRGGVLSGPPKILHGRDRNLEQVKSCFETHDPWKYRMYRPRTRDDGYLMQRKQVTVAEELAAKVTNSVRGFGWELRHHGLGTALRQTVRHLTARPTP